MRVFIYEWEWASGRVGGGDRPGRGRRLQLLQREGNEEIKEERFEKEGRKVR